MLGGWSLEGLGRSGDKICFVLLENFVSKVQAWVCWNKAVVVHNSQVQVGVETTKSFYSIPWKILYKHESMFLNTTLWLFVQCKSSSLLDKILIAWLLISPLSDLTYSTSSQIGLTIRDLCNGNIEKVYILHGLNLLFI